MLLAVSGGLDSICLAHFFVTHKADLGIEWLGIAHVHHGLREGTADRDAEFVKVFAAQNQSPFFLGTLDGEALKAAEGSLENNARDARYDALRKFAHENRADAIVTAHHTGDQAETVYLRLRRGVSLAGLQGIQSVRLQATDTDLPHEAVFLYRPFLDVSRKELQEYARDNNLDWCEDESNSDVKFTRNQIRHEALPTLEKLHPGATSQLVRIASKTVSAYERILTIADKLFLPLVISRDDGLTLDTKKGKISLKNGMDEIFRLWLDCQGYRFPVGTFKGKALLNDIRNLSYRTRFIEKKRNIIRICEKKASADI